MEYVMLTATPLGWLSWDFRIECDSGTLAIIDQSWWREKATIDIGGQYYEVGRDGIVGAFRMTLYDKTIASANKVSVFSRSFEIRINGKQYALKAAGLFTQHFNLWQGDQKVGRVEKRGIFRRTADIHFPDDIPQPVQVFLFWLVLILWKRESDQSS